MAAETLDAATQLTSDAWWSRTVSPIGSPRFAPSERDSPASIIVNLSGKRLINESTPYAAACQHMHGGQYGQAAGPGENVPARPVFDQRYRDHYFISGRL